MCIGVAVKIIEQQGFHALCEGRNGEELVNMMLIGPQPVGTWVVNFLGSARDVISEEDAINANKALDALEAVMNGETDIDMKHYFPDLTL
jgi:hydrogenase expression/formation protein HypC